VSGRFLRYAAAIVLAGAAFSAPVQAAPPAPSARTSSNQAQATPPVNPDEPRGADLNPHHSPAQMFANACSVCHKTPQGLAKNASGNLAGFLRQHYTTGESQASTLASYLASVGGSRAAPVTSPTAPDKPEKPAAAGGRKPAGSESDTAARENPAAPAANEKKRQPAEQAGEPAPKPAHNRRAPRTEPEDLQPAEAKPVEAKPAEAKPEGKPEAKPAEAKHTPPARERRTRQQEASKPPVEPEKPAPAPAAEAPKPAQPAASAAPPPEPKPAAPAAPQIPL
jgi:hypothetical protein